jgi:plastocyanin
MRPHSPHPTALAALCLIACAAAPAAATNFNVMTGPGLAFTPATLTITAGDTVTFTNTAQGFHNVHADDESFRCANGCDGQGGDGSPSTNLWSFHLTFNTAGTVGYHCEIHGSPGAGMHGTITVNPQGGGSPGSLSFSRNTFTVAENAGNAAILVQRTGGTTGAVSVHYATSDGTGVAGTNYRTATGTLNWSDGDASTQSFNVQVLDDGVVNGSHTVNLGLSGPTGGATLGTANALLTITDSDTAPSPPAAPSDLTATAIDSTDIHLTWTVHSNNEMDFRVQSKVLDGSAFADLLPLLPAGTNHLTVSGLKPATGYGFQVRAENTSGNSAFTPEADAATSGPCVADANTLCLGSGQRFKATVNWMTGDGRSGLGTAVPLAANPESGLFYFFGPGNIEMLIKVLNACAPPFNAYWVFFAATTNVEFNVTVIDTQASKTQVYHNDLNHAALPVQDTAAFLTCP